MAAWLKTLHDSVRDDRYLVGMRLQDHSDKVPPAKNKIDPNQIKNCCTSIFLFNVQFYPCGLIDLSVRYYVCFSVHISRSLLSCVQFVSGLWACKIMSAIQRESNHGPGPSLCKKTKYARVPTHKSSPTCACIPALYNVFAVLESSYDRGGHFCCHSPDNGHPKLYTCRDAVINPCQMQVSSSCFTGGYRVQVQVLGLVWGNFFRDVVIRSTSCGYRVRTLHSDGTHLPHCFSAVADKCI